MKSVNPDRLCWSRILYALNPDGRIPQRSVEKEAANALTTLVGRGRRFRPRLFEAGEVLPAGMQRTLAEVSERLHSEAVDAGWSRSAINLPADLRDEVVDALDFNQLEGVSGPVIRNSVECLLLYYDGAGMLPLHVDDQDEFEYNLLYCVKRVKGYCVEPRGTLFWLGEEAFYSDLDEGEALFFDAHRTAHGRLPVPPDEVVVLLSLGLQAGML